MTTVEVLRRENRALLVAFLATTAASVATLWLWIVLADPRNPWNLVWQVVGLLTVPGKYVVFAGLTPGSPVGPWGLAVIGLVADTWLALGLAALLAPLRRMRWLVPKLVRANERAGEVLAAYPGLGRAAFWGVTLFVVLPLPGTGAVGGTFAGQLLGLGRIKTVGAVALGSAITLAAFAGLATFVGKRAQQLVANPWITVAATVVFAGVVWVAYLRVKNLLRAR